jgi:hypothetical protein
MGIYDKPAPVVPMKKLPDFEYGTLYEIKVCRAVELAPDLWARPSSARIVVDGDKARELGDAVIWAKKA